MRLLPALVTALLVWARSCRGVRRAAARKILGSADATA